MKIDATNLNKVGRKYGLSERELRSQAKKLPSYLGRIEAYNQGFYTCIDDEKMVKEIENFVAQQSGRFQDIVVLGIGGSALGTICLQQALKHLFINELAEGTHPKLHVLDNIDPNFLSQVRDVIDYEKTMVIVASKSGTTPETLAQYFYFHKEFRRLGLNPKEHFVFITDSKKSFLRKVAKEECLKLFAIPDNVGGRFSVLTAVGLLPAKLIGIDIRELLAGAREMRNNFLSTDFETNLPFQLATMQYLLSKKGKRTIVLMPYSQNLISLADWYRQLLAESIGKLRNRKGKKIYAGLTPISALGATDQHSQSQLYNEGPNDKFIIFIEVLNLGPIIDFPDIFPEEETVNFLRKASFNKLMQVEKRATAISYTENKRPNITLKIDKVNERSLGELFMLFEGSIAFLGEYYYIDAFDQPGVELSKQLTKKMLLEEQ